jgi:16S rRNA (cytosine1402-N4)-methyltransferase
MTKTIDHIPVLKNEVISSLALKNGGVYVDGTAGRGGHIDAVLSKAKELGFKSIDIVAIDKDPINADYLQEKYSKDNLDKKLGSNDYRVIVVNSDYRFIKDILSFHNLNSADGVILDLGFSSIHIDDPSRGFSFSKDGPLDMRYDPKQSLSAEIVVNEYSDRDLKKIIKDYGEEGFYKNIVKEIVLYRDKKQIKTTFELRDIVHKAIPMKFKKPGIDTATKTFQAIRIEVNKELESLESFFKDINEALSPGARLCIISFHSLEDRMVKKAINSMIDTCTCPEGLVQCVCGKKALFKWVSRSIIGPADKEIVLNPRSRSAKLRVAEKI